MEKGWTQAELAKLCGIRREYISQIENGRNSPTQRTLERLAKALGVEIIDLFKPTKEIEED